MKKRYLKILFVFVFAFFMFSCSKPVDVTTLSANEEAKYYKLEEGNYLRVTYTDEEEVVLVGIVLEGTNNLYVEGVLTEIPEIEDREGYKEKWSIALNKVRKDTTIKAVYTIEEYTVTFIHYGEVIQSSKMEYGTVLTEEDLPEIKDVYGVSSKKWNIELPYTVKSTAKFNSEMEYIEFSDVANEEFDELMDELFYSFLGTDPLSINFNLYHPENFYKEGVFDFNECVFEGYDFSEEGNAEVAENCKYYIDLLEGFADEDLTEDQYLSKIVIIKNLENNVKYADYLYYGSYLGSYLGYQAQLPLTLSEYRFDDKKCIDDYLSYIQYTQQIFEGIVAMEQEKIAQGMPLSDYVINKVIGQCDEYINEDSENPNFLIPVVNSKIEACDFLTDEEKEYYIEKNTRMVEENFVAAYTYLRNELEKMLGSEDTVVLENGEEYIGALAQMEKGKEYYELILQDNLGTNMSVDEVYEYINKLIKNNIGKYRNDVELVDQLQKDNVMKNEDLKLEDLIPFFMEAIKEDFPELNVELEYSINNIHSSLQKNSSPAMYYISPIDDNLTESIYINPSEKDLVFPSTQMYTTIAHEGYPGHLYQNVYMKNLDTLPNVRKILSQSSYAEGWATHIEYYVLNYVYDDPSYSELLLAYDSITYLCFGAVDIGVNYYGWDFEDVKKYLGQYFNIDDESIKEIMYDMTEIPTNYLMYFFSCYQFRDLMEDFKDLMGDEYSDKLFHTIVLDCGAVTFDVLEYRLKAYYVENVLNK